jgi:hypothetical protein
VILKEAELTREIVWDMHITVNETTDKSKVDCTQYQVYIPDILSGKDLEDQIALEALDRGAAFI